MYTAECKTGAPYQDTENAENEASLVEVLAALRLSTVERFGGGEFCSFVITGRSSASGGG
jgi:hypothetical protein